MHALSNEAPTAGSPVSPETSGSSSVERVRPQQYAQRASVDGQTSARLAVESVYNFRVAGPERPQLDPRDKAIIDITKDLEESSEREVYYRLQNASGLVGALKTMLFQAGIANGTIEKAVRKAVKSDEKIAGGSVFDWPAGEVWRLYFEKTTRPTVYRLDPLVHREWIFEKQRISDPEPYSYLRFSIEPPMNVTEQYTIRKIDQLGREERDINSEERDQLLYWVGLASQAISNIAHRAR